jgi:hypothetical protein
VDIPRTQKSRRPRRIALIAGGAVALVGATVALRELEPAAPTVERATLVIDTVRRGPLVRQVRAPGTLVPEHVRIISAVTAGRVEALPVRPGTTVDPTTVLLELSNPDVQLQLLEAERQLAAAEAGLVSQRTALIGQRLAQEATVATVASEGAEARRQAEMVGALGKRQFATVNEVARANDRVEEYGRRMRVERERLQLMGGTVQQQLALEASNVERLRAIVQFQRDPRGEHARDRRRAGRAAADEPRARAVGGAGAGARARRAARAPQGRAARPRDAGARRGRRAAGAGGHAPLVGGGGSSVVTGRVMRVDPAVQNGTVTVEVALEGALPRGARGDLSVDGTIELERLPNVLSVARPAYGQPESTVGLFKLDADGTHAVRIPVQLGRASVNAIEIVRGLNPGDRVIVSDLSQYDGSERLRVK